MGDGESARMPSVSFSESLMTFASLGLLDPLLKALEGLGHGTPTPIQAQTIPRRSRAATCSPPPAQTGTGKTAGFALPLLQRLTLEGPQVAANSVRALVLVPTRELAEQVHASVRDYGQHLPRTAVAYGGVSINPQMMKLRKECLVATPGRLLDLYRQNAVKFAQLQALVLDEADPHARPRFRPRAGRTVRRAAAQAPDPAVFRDLLRRHPHAGP